MNILIRLGENPTAPNSLWTKSQGFSGNRVQTKVRRLTRLIDVTAEDSDPKRAQMIAEAVVTEFLKYSREQNASLSRAANEFLNQEADRLKSKLNEAEQKLQKHRMENDTVSLEDKQNIVVDKLRKSTYRPRKLRRIACVWKRIEQIKRIEPSEHRGIAAHRECS